MNVIITITSFRNEVVGKQSKEKMTTKKHITENWRNPHMLNSFLGSQWDEPHTEFNFGDIPTHKASIEVQGNCIVRIRTYSGNSWTARYGYGEPVCDVK
jgi:hypothetical protein